MGRGAGLEGGGETLIDYVVVVWRYRLVIFGLCVTTLFGTFSWTITRPKIYEAKATLLSPREGATAFLGGIAATGLLQQVPGLALPSLTPNRDMLVSILRSRTLTQKVVDRFRLQERYQVSYIEDAIGALQRTAQITVSKEGVIALTVSDTDPHLASEIANFYIDQLDRLAARFGTGEAGRQRVFVTAQLARAKVGLELAEEALRRFQERNRAVVLQEQTRGAIEAAARLKGEVIASEVQLEVMRNFATDTNPEVVALRRKIEEMRRQLAQMQFGDAVSGPQSAVDPRDQRDFSMPFARVPQLGLELARFSRDVKVQETLVTLLGQQLEQVKLVEAKDLPVVQVLDRAVPAARPSWPRLRLNLAVAGLASFSAGVLVALAIGRYRGRRAQT